MHNETLTKLLHAQDKKVPVALITKLSDGSQAIVDKNKTVDGDVTIDDQQLEEVLGYIRDDKSRSLGEGEYFVQVFNPKLSWDPVLTSYLSEHVCILVPTLGR